MTASYAIMGWAQSKTAVSDVTDASCTLQYHDNGFGQYGMLIGSALSEQYSTWLSDAGLSAGTPSGNSSTSAVPTATASATATASSSATATSAIPAATETLGEYDYIVVGGGAGGLISELFPFSNLIAKILIGVSCRSSFGDWC